jgi:uncharacterized protein (DUF2147 family)
LKNRYELLNDVEIDLDEYKNCILSDEERENTKNAVISAINKRHKVSYKRYSIFVACFAVAIIATQMTFAKNITNNVVDMISAKYNTFVKSGDKMTVKIPDNLKGTLYDKDGNVLDTYTAGEKMYTKDGKQEMIIDVNPSSNFNVGLTGEQINGEIIMTDIINDKEKKK